MGEGTLVRTGNKRRVQVRKVRKVRKERRDGPTAARKQVFFDHLAACCNVTRAAAAARGAGSGVHFVHFASPPTAPVPGQRRPPSA